MHNLSKTNQRICWNLRGNSPSIKYRNQWKDNSTDFSINCLLYSWNRNKFYQNYGGTAFQPDFQLRWVIKLRNWMWSRWILRFRRSSVENEFWKLDLFRISAAAYWSDENVMFRKNKLFTFKMEHLQQWIVKWWSISYSQLKGRQQTSFATRWTTSSYCRGNKKFANSSEEIGWLQRKKNIFSFPKFKCNFFLQI